MIISVIIPAHNEEKSIAKVIKDIPKNLVEEIIVVNNNSNDKTSYEAKNAGATVLDELKPGYGNACLLGMEYFSDKGKKTDIIIFLDGDYSDFPEEIVHFVDEIKINNTDFVVGSRMLGDREKGSLKIQQIFGNWLATRLIKIFFSHKYTDLGPFRAIKYDKLLGLKMNDKNYGWTVEMQIKAIKNKLSIKEIPVSYRKRIGHSKVSGTVKGTILAGIKIIYTIFKYI